MAHSPTTPRLDGVVVPTQRSEVHHLGSTALGYSMGVVEITVLGRHPTAWPNACGIAGFDVASLSGGWPPPGGAVPGHVAGVRVGDRHSPFPIGLLLDSLTGDVGDDRAPSRDLPGPLGEPHERGQVDADVDRRPPPSTGVDVAFE